MEDIAPGLLEKIQKQFYHDIEKSSIVKNFKKQAQRGKISYSQANEVAQEIGKILAQSYSDNLSSGILPDGKMYYNIASRVLNPTLKEAYEMAADNAAIVQQIMNEAAGIGIKTIRAQIQQDNINGIVNRISSEEYFDDVKWDYVLNRIYLPDDEEDEKVYKQHLKDIGVSNGFEFFQGRYKGMYPEEEARIRESWKRAFRIDKWTIFNVCGNIWEIKREWVKRIIKPGEEVK